MNSFTATELDAEGLPFPIVATWPDIADEVDGPSPQSLADAKMEGAQEMLNHINSCCTEGLERVHPKKRTAAIGLRLAALMLRLRRQPLGCDDHAALGDQLGVTKNGAWQAGERAFGNLLKPTS